jgi:hypothetical protein
MSNIIQVILELPCKLFGTLQPIMMSNICLSGIKFSEEWRLGISRQFAYAHYSHTPYILLVAF